MFELSKQKHFNPNLYIGKMWKMFSFWNENVGEDSECTSFSGEENEWKLDETAANNVVISDLNKSAIYKDISYFLRKILG